MNFKLKIGVELKKILDEKKDCDEIAKWADRVYANNCREVDENLESILFSLSALTLGEEFNLTNEKLYQMADNLILEGKKEDLSFADNDSQKAMKIDDFWLMCPVCQESWEDHGIYKMTRCPQCNSKLFNPNFLEKQ